MSGAQSLTSDVDIDIKGLLSAIWRRKLLLLAITLIGGGLLFAFLSTISPRYKSDAQILITKRESVFTRIQTNEFQNTGGEFDEQAVASQVLVLNSDDLAAQVIKKLNLESHEEFQPEQEGGLLSLAASLISEPEDTSAVPGAVAPELSVSPAVLKKFKEQMTVYAAEKSRVIVVEFWSRDRRLARDVPNTMAELYLQATRDATLETDSTATDWLGPEIEKLREMVREAEARAAEFRSQSDILLGNNNALMATQQLSEVSSELSRVRAERTAAEARIETIRSALANGSSLDVVPEVISSPLIQRLRERQVEIQTQISELSTTLLPNHPRIKALRSQLPEIENQIRRAAQDILTSLETTVTSSRNQEQDLLQELNRYKSESARGGEAEVQLRALEREAAAQRERLENYLVRFNEAESRQNSGYIPSQARIIEHAVLPAEAYFPKVGPFTAAGMTALLILSMVGIIAVELLSGRAFKPVGQIRQEDIPMRAEPAIAGQAPGATVPLAAAAPPLVPDYEQAARSTPPRAPMQATMPANDTDAFPPEFAIEALAAMDRASVAVINPAGNADNAVFVSTLARSLAAKGRSVAVVDFTGEGTTSRHMLGSAVSRGLFDVLGGTMPLRDVLFADRVSAAHVLAPGNTPEPAAAARAMGRLGTVLGSLERSYQFSICDCGDAAVEGLARIAGTDTVVFVPVNAATMAEGRRMEQQLKSAGFFETVMVRDAAANAAMSAA